MNPITILVDGNPVPSIRFEHQHGRPEDVFLLVQTTTPVPPGTEVAWTGDMPTGKTALWVRIPCEVGKWGTFLLREEDRR